MTLDRYIFFIIADFVNYSNKITQMTATSEYKLLRDCLLILENKMNSDILNTFPDIQPYIDAYQLSFAWFYQAAKGICTGCWCSVLNISADFSLESVDTFLRRTNVCPNHKLVPYYLSIHPDGT